MVVMEQIQRGDLEQLQESAHRLLDELVTPDGIYASAAIGWEGPYHAWFGRDGAITADFLVAATEYGGDRALARTAIQALVKFSDYQGKAPVAATGEETGKLPHEVRAEFNDVDGVQHAARTNELPWYIDPEDDTLKNWDTADGTALWGLALLRAEAQEIGGYLKENTEIAERLRAALDWIMRTIGQYDGLVGFVGAGEQPGREYSGLHNQGWKDTEAIYQTPAGDNAPHPIKDVLVNAEAWAVLREGADFFAATDDSYSQRLREAADKLKRRFNDPDDGFLLDTENVVLAQAIDGSDTRLEQSSVDQGAVLWAHTGNKETIVDERVKQRLVSLSMSDKMFNDEAGVRNYAKGTKFNHGTRYHGSSTTYWPFMSGMIARGMEQTGFDSEAERVMKAYLNAVRTLGTNIEMFIQNENDEFEPWSHPDPEIGQMSSREQAWTAAAVYYATSYLLHDERGVSNIPSDT